MYVVESEVKIYSWHFTRNAANEKAATIRKEKQADVVVSFISNVPFQAAGTVILFASIGIMLAWRG